VLPTKGVLVEWRAGEIERRHGAGDDQNAQDVRWLVFELRRARSALTKLLALAEEMGDEAPDDAARGQMRFIANEALGLYPIAAEPIGVDRLGAATGAPRAESKTSG
jgi:hypothetical protein